MIDFQPDCTSFATLESWLRELPDQITGIPTAICQTGEPYVEFRERALARPSDAKVIESNVAERMSSRLREYLCERSGLIYWRVPFEYETKKHSVVVRYDESGPDKDFVSDRKCVMDHDWVCVSCYCRLYRAKHAFSGFEFSVTPAKDKAA